MRLGMRDERDPAVVRDVEPLVRVRRPRVGPLDAVDEVAELGRGSRPEPERRVHVQPCARATEELCDLPDGVDAARVHLADLGTDDCGPVVTVERGRHGGGRRASLAVHLGRRDGPAPEPEQPQRTVDRDVALAADDDPDRRRSREPAALDVPARTLEHRVPGRGETRHVRHLAAGDERERGVGREPEKLQEPVTRDLLRHRRRGTSDDEPGVLVPDARQPVRREGRGDCAADDEAEVTPARDRDHAWLAGRRERLDHLQRVDWVVRQLAAERFP